MIIMDITLLTEINIIENKSKAIKNFDSSINVTNWGTFLVLILLPLCKHRNGSDDTCTL